jgi:two-component sensor histidine kinase
VAGYYSATQRHNAAAPLADFCTAAYSMAIFNERFLARLQSLAASQEILSEVVEHGVNLAALIQSQVILGEGEHRIICRGQDVFLAADTGLEVGLVLHELGTNARKYGALSSATGQITIDWQIVRRDGPLSVRMIWVEQKGPPVTKPVNTGFGSKLLEYALRKAGGQISVNYETSGFVCHMLIPIERHNSSKSIEK